MSFISPVFSVPRLRRRSVVIKPLVGFVDGGESGDRCIDEPFSDLIHLAGGVVADDVHVVGEHQNGGVDHPGGSLDADPFPLSEEPPPFSHQWYLASAASCNHAIMSAA